MPRRTDSRCAVYHTAETADFSQLAAKAGGRGGDEPRLNNQKPCA
jgi:hypothetical protein